MVNSGQVEDSEIKSTSKTLKKNIENNVRIVTGILQCIPVKNPVKLENLEFWD